MVPVTPNPNYEKGVSFLNRRHDSAYFYLNKAAAESKDSLQIAQAYSVMAIIQNREGDYYGGQEGLLASLRYLHAGREGDRYCLVADYNGLGSTSLNLKNYDAAIGYYDQAMRLAKDERSKGIALNNKAFAYQQKGEYAQAIAIYDSIIVPSKKDKKEFARVLCNLATARWLQEPGYRAASDLLTALQIRKEGNDDWGLNSSYAHLADYYMHSRPDSAMMYARDMLAIASRLNSPDDKLEAMGKLILLAPSTQVRSYFSAYDRLRDSLETARNRAKNQFALIRYDAEKNKADNLRLQRENAERSVQLIRQRVLTAGIVAVAVVLIGWVFFWYRRRKQKLEWEKESARKEERLQASKKVHDVVANGLYRIMAEMEHGHDMDKEDLLDKMDAIYKQSRDIYFEPDSEPGGDFQGMVPALIGPFGHAGTKVSIIGNDKELWKDVGEKTRKELKLILQELMVNMNKHSGAQNVLLRFEREGEGLNIQYQDDGVGFPADIPFGNGLTNTGNRISGIGGRIIFERNTPTGARIRIYLPNA